MNPELSRYLAKAFNSPYWWYTYLRNIGSDRAPRKRFINFAESGKKIPDLPNGDRAFLDDCVASADAAQKRGVKLPYTDESVMPIVKEILDNAKAKK